MVKVPVGSQKRDKKEGERAYWGTDPATERTICMEVKELMNPSVVTIEPTASAALAARRLRGMVTDRDIVLRCVAAEEDPAQTLVRDIMTRGCTAVSPRDDCREATRLMSVYQVRRLPVVEEGRLVGIVSLADLARSQRYDMEAAQALGEISENIIHRRF